MQLEITPTAYNAPRGQPLPGIAKRDEAKSMLQQTLDTLEQSKTALAENRKAMAAQRVTYLKESIHAMRSMPGLDGKSIARMTARMAKDLSAAVKDYTQGVKTMESPVPYRASGIHMYQAVQASVPDNSLDKGTKEFAAQVGDIAGALKILSSTSRALSGWSFFNTTGRDNRIADQALSSIDNDLSRLLIPLNPLYRT